ncbi:MAG: FAD-binding protein [Armatimonadetes bacterium]|nr:FAD-binding protein [Armatimonadota bacterium]MDE2206054.1 FAD-binding protein [Armatimonadota bacterium]
MPHLLVLAETDGRSVAPNTGAAVAFAQQWARASSGTFDLLICGGAAVVAAAENWQEFGARTVAVAADAALAQPVADRLGEVVRTHWRRAGNCSIAAASSTSGRDVLARIAGLCDLPMLSDVIAVEAAGGTLRAQRPMYAGSVLATVELLEPDCVFSVRSTAYGAPERSDSVSPVESVPIDPSALPSGTRWVGLDAPELKRPELTTARVVVSGGRPLKDAETFERVLGALADRLGGALGATRAAVDSGIAPNDYQVGQTGKVVAPELYIAAGISGSVQHLAGMKESRVIVAINTDPDAPIFQAADYGLVMDLFQAVPELTARL